MKNLQALHVLTVTNSKNEKLVLYFVDHSEMNATYWHFHRKEGYTVDRSDGGYTIYKTAEQAIDEVSFWNN